MNNSNVRRGAEKLPGGIRLRPNVVPGLAIKELNRERRGAHRERGARTPAFSYPRETSGHPSRSTHVPTTASYTDTDAREAKEIPCTDCSGMPGAVVKFAAASSGSSASAWQRDSIPIFSIRSAVSKATICERLTTPATIEIGDWWFDRLARSCPAWKR